MSKYSVKVDNKLYYGVDRSQVSACAIMLFTRLLLSSKELSRSKHFENLYEQAGFSKKKQTRKIQTSSIPVAGTNTANGTPLVLVRGACHGGNPTPTKTHTIRASTADGNLAKDSPTTHNRMSA